MAENNYFNGVIAGVHYREFRIPIWERVVMLPIVFYRHWHCTTPTTPKRLKLWLAWELTKAYWLNETYFIYKPAS